jgi:hypothetical protein
MKSLFICLLIILCLILPILTYAETETYYQCVDSNGNEFISNNPSSGMCKPVGEFNIVTEEQKEKYEKEKEEQRIAEEKAAAEAAKLAKEREKEERIIRLEQEAAQARKEAEEAKAAANRAWYNAENARLKAEEAQETERQNRVRR